MSVVFDSANAIWGHVKWDASTDPILSDQNRNWQKFTPDDMIIADLCMFPEPKKEEKDPMKVGAEDMVITLKEQSNFTFKAQSHFYSCTVCSKKVELYLTVSLCQASSKDRVERICSDCQVELIFLAVDLLREKKGLAKCSVCHDRKYVESDGLPSVCPECGGK